MAKIVDYSVQMLFNAPYEEEDSEDEKIWRKEYSINEEDVGCDPVKLAEFVNHENEMWMNQIQDSDEVKDPRQQQAADAVYNVLEEMIQLPASKKICYAHHVDEEILTKVLHNLKNSIHETFIQLEKRAPQVQAHEQQERKRKLTSYVPDSADAVNNVSEEITQLPASKEIRYTHESA